MRKWESFWAMLVWAAVWPCGSGAKGMEKVFCFDEVMYVDTLGITMYTRHKVYPPGTEQVKVYLVNRSGRQLSMGEQYSVVRREDDRWVRLSMPVVWNRLALGVEPGAMDVFTAALYPKLNDIRPGVYRVVKRLDVEGECTGLNMVAEFRVADGASDGPENMNRNVEPQSEPLADCPYRETEDDIAFEVVEEMPEFPGGIGALMEFVRKNLRHELADTTLRPKPRVVVQFVIDEEGRITRPRILRSLGKALDAEALRVLRMMPRWKPGRQNGVAVKVKYALPVIFGKYEESSK